MFYLLIFDSFTIIIIHPGLNFLAVQLCKIIFKTIYKLKNKNTLILRCRHFIKQHESTSPSTTAIFRCFIITEIIFSHITFIYISYFFCFSPRSFEVTTTRRRLCSHQKINRLVSLVQHSASPYRVDERCFLRRFFRLIRRSLTCLTRTLIAISVCHPY